MGPHPALFPFISHGFSSQLYPMDYPLISWNIPLFSHYAIHIPSISLIFPPFSHYSPTIIPWIFHYISIIYFISLWFSMCPMTIIVYSHSYPMNFPKWRCHPDQTPGPPPVAPAAAPRVARRWRRRTRGTWTRTVRRGSGAAAQGWGAALGCLSAASWAKKQYQWCRMVPPSYKLVYKPH